MSYSGHAGPSSGSSACCVICWPSTVLQVSHLSYHLWSGLLLCISSWSSGTALLVSQLPSSLLWLWLCYAFLPFRDRTSNFLLLTSFVSLSSSFNTSFYFCSHAQWFSSYFPDQQHHHLLETGWKCTFLCPTTNKLNQKLWRWGSAIWIQQPRRWFWCMLKFQNHSSLIYLFSALANIWITWGGFLHM